MRQAILVGLIGANIQKSLSPAMFEDACAALGIAGHYHLMDLDRLPGRSLSDLLAAARTAGFAGVTSPPCKEAVLPLLDEVCAEARRDRRRQHRHHRCRRPHHRAQHRPHQAFAAASRRRSAATPSPAGSPCWSAPAGRAAPSPSPSSISGCSACW